MILKTCTLCFHRVDRHAIVTYLTRTIHESREHQKLLKRTDQCAALKLQIEINAAEQLLLGFRHYAG